MIKLLLVRGGLDEVIVVKEKDSVDFRDACFVSNDMGTMFCKTVFFLPYFLSC